MKKENIKTKKTNPYKKIKARVRITFTGDDKFFGKGVAELLHLIDEYGTIQKACSLMDMSYTKAWRIIKRLEKELGFTIIDAVSGGVSGGKSLLTDKAKDLIKRYDKLEKNVSTYATKAYKNIFYKEN
ncbi:MAG: LysR family transcriptional regulator [Lachnospiraceae bacterium]|nr:LysR family transcriptional regulator [Lachnospiraceae bacterium]